MSIRLHLDEQVHSGVAVALRARGIDVTTTADVGLRGADDPEQLTFAGAAGRILVTHDEDFLGLVADGRLHSGIAYCHPEKYTIGQLISMIQLLHACYDPDDMRGRVEFL